MYAMMKHDGEYKLDWWQGEIANSNVQHVIGLKPKDMVCNVTTVHDARTYRHDFTQ